MSVRDPKLIKKIGEATALEVRATGIPYTFAPCIAVIEKTAPHMIFFFFNFKKAALNQY